MKLPTPAILAMTTCAAFGADAVIVVATPDGGAVPDAEVAADGAVHVAYGKGNDTFHAKSADAGATWSAPLRVNSAAGTAHPPHSFRGPDLALDASGAAHVVWYPGNPHVGVKTEGGIRYARLPKGAAAFEPERNLNNRPSENFAVAARADGSVATVWTARGIFTQTGANGGTTFADSEQIAIADNCECCATRAIFLPDGALALAYRGKADNQRDMFVAIQRGGKWTQDRISGTPWKINACPMSGTYLAPAANGGLVMGIETKGAISWAEIGADGRKAREVIVKNARGKYPVVLRSPAGETLVSWKDGDTLRWQTFGANGVANGPGASKKSGNTTRHAGAVLHDGRFLLID